MAPLQACSVPLTRSGRHGSKFVNPKTAAATHLEQLEGRSRGPGENLPPRRASGPLILRGRSTDQGPGWNNGAKWNVQAQFKVVRIQHPSAFGFSHPVSRAARRTPEAAQGADWLSSLSSYWLEPGSGGAAADLLSNLTGCGDWGFRRIRGTCLGKRWAVGAYESLGPCHFFLPYTALLCFLPFFFWRFRSSRTRRHGLGN